MSQLEAQITAAKTLVAYLEGLRESPVTPPPTKDIGGKVRRLLYSSKWPTAVDQRLLCNTNSDSEKIHRGRGILEHVIDRHLTYNDSILDFGCGEGHLTWAVQEIDPRIVVGYDITDQGWCRYPKRDTLQFTPIWDIVRGNGPYNIIIAYDVLDHTQDPVESLLQMQNVLTGNGRIYLRCHPWTARHGGHAHQFLNRAYCHLLYPEELVSFGWTAPPQQVTDPLRTYGRWISKANMRVISERPQTSPVEPIFTGVPAIAKKLSSLGALDVQFVDYTLKL